MSPLKGPWAWGLIAAVLLAGCPGGGDVRDDRDTVEAVDAGTPDGAQSAEAKPERPPLTPVAKPRFDPNAPAPCASHTACYLAAKQAHESGARAGYLLALDRCEFYRGSYQLEEFYGLCLLILADAYRHLDNFEEAAACYQRFLDTNPDAGDLALQARAALDEVTRGQQTPHAYHDYLEAVSLLTRYGESEDRAQLERARELLAALSADQPDWFLADKVKFLIAQIEDALAAPGPDATPARAGAEPPAEPGPATPAAPEEAGDPAPEVD